MAKKKPTKRGRNLIRKDDYIINQYDVKISQDEARRLRNAVTRANQKRRQMELQFQNQPLFQGKKKLDESREQLRLMGEEMDIMIRKRSNALNQFRTKGDFTRYLKSAENAAKIDYLDYRGKLYKRNYIAALKSQYAEYPDLVKGAAMKIQMMPQKEFQALVASNRMLQIKFHYSPSNKLNQLMEFRDFLGLSSDYDDYEDMDEF